MSSEEPDPEQGPFDDEDKGSPLRILISIVVVLLLVSTIIYISMSTPKTDLPIVREAPPFTLINQDNENVSLSQLEGKVVLIGFIFTRCPEPTMCQWITRNFKEIQDDLGSRFGEEVVLITMSFDPYDTPEIMKTYGEVFGADFSGWHFLTGDNATVDAVMDSYGVVVIPEGDDEFTHSMISVLIDQNGDIKKEYWGNEWRVETVLGHIDLLLGEE